MTDNQFKEKLIKELSSISRSLKSIDKRLAILDSNEDSEETCNTCEHNDDKCICPFCTRNKYDHRYFKERDFFKKKGD